MRAELDGDVAVSSTVQKQIEMPYVESRSEARFSHGLCPDCKVGKEHFSPE